MDLFDLVYILTAWLVVAFAVAPTIGRGIRAGAGDHAEPDATWLADQPQEIRLTDTEVRLRCADIEAAEGWATR